MILKNVSLEYKFYMVLSSYILVYMRKLLIQWLFLFIVIIPQVI